MTNIWIVLNILCGDLMCYTCTFCPSNDIPYYCKHDTSEATQAAEFQRCMVPLFRQIWRCLNSSHFQVAECALFLWNNDYIINLMSQHRYEILPLILLALEKNVRNHWSMLVDNLTWNVRKMLMDMDKELFQEFQRRFHEEETKAIRTQEKHEMTWQCLEAIVVSKALSCR